MPTITERRRRNGFPIAGLVLALGAWFGGMAALASVFDPSAVIVFGPGQTAVTSVAASDGELLTSGIGFATARSDRAGFVRRLYRRGAWLVWPSLQHGCFAADRFTRS